MSDFERHAVQRLIEKATGLGVPIPAEIKAIAAGTNVCGGRGGYAAIERARLYPEEDEPCGCWGYVLDGPEGCNCWVAVYDVEQQPVRPPADVVDVAVAAGMCGDCAFRPGSPERAEEWTADALYAMPAQGRVFWCHQGMRRPVLWRHPDGREVDGDSADWKPPIVNSVPYQADGSPGLVCAGWAALAAKVASVDV